VVLRSIEVYRLHQFNRRLNWSEIEVQLAFVLGSRIRMSHFAEMLFGEISIHLSGKLAALGKACVMFITQASVCHGGSVTDTQQAVSQGRVTSCWSPASISVRLLKLKEYSDMFVCPSSFCISVPFLGVVAYFWVLMRGPYRFGKRCALQFVTDPLKSTLFY